MSFDENASEDGFGLDQFKVYQLALDFTEWAANALRRHVDQVLADQLSRATQSIPLNIAEGAGRTSDLEKRRFYSIARGSACECVAIVDVAYRRGLITSDCRAEGRRQLLSLVRILTKLARG
jgi:four helix bundle protein